MTWKSEKQHQQELLESIKELKKQHKRETILNCLELTREIKSGVSHIHKAYDVDFKIDKDKIDQITQKYLNEKIIK